MNLGLQGRSGIVTGSSRGIGRATAHALAAEGADVVVHGLEVSDTERVANELRELGARAVAVTADLTTDEGADRLVNAAREAFGAVHILINNLGVFSNTTWRAGSAQDWLRLYDTNVGSAVRMIGRVLQEMADAGWGRIIQISSGQAIMPDAIAPDYSATKAAIINLTVSLSKELGGTGVTVNTVTPGLIHTEGIEIFFRNVASRSGWGENWSDIESHVVAAVVPNAAGRLGRPDEVADVVVFLAGERASYITGANIRVDGGCVPTVN